MHRRLQGRRCRGCWRCAAAPSAPGSWRTSPTCCSATPLRQPPSADSCPTLARIRCSWIIPRSVGASCALGADRLPVDLVCLMLSYTLLCLRMPSCMCGSAVLPCRGYVWVGVIGPSFGAGRVLLAGVCNLAHDYPSDVGARGRVPGLVPCAWAGHPAEISGAAPCWAGS